VIVSSLKTSSAPAGYRFPREVIAVAVRWYLRYGLSYRDVEELLAERVAAGTPAKRARRRRPHSARRPNTPHSRRVPGRRLMRSALQGHPATRALQHAPRVANRLAPTPTPVTSDSHV